MLLLASCLESTSRAHSKAIRLHFNLGLKDQLCVTGRDVRDFHTETERETESEGETWIDRTAYRNVAEETTRIGRFKR